MTKHFAYNAQWDTLQGYPDSFGSAGDLNDHHFHYGYFIHAAALVGSFDAEWAMNQKQMVDLLVADVAGTDVAETCCHVCEASVQWRDIHGHLDTEPSPVEIIMNQVLNQ